MSQQEVVVITGPTASGKSAFGVSLAKRFSGEIVNADSVQMYRDFDIGSCKPSKEELALVPHHLLSELNPAEEFDAGAFCNRAKEVITSLHDREVLPVVVGGSGMYIRSLLCGLIPVGEISDEIEKEVSVREEMFRQESSSEEELSRKNVLMA